ncbi:MAG: hypothetical protein OEW97_08395, partial [Gammaproteobacteria bacterium]|nr:hypothetical protein [Gammaproteobacteria bacterium]
MTEAWDQLLTVVSEEEANDLVKNYRPFNIGNPTPQGLSRNDTIVNLEYVIFPQTDEVESKLHSWSEPPSTNILPERLVFVAFQNGEQVISPVLGNLIPPKLILGPDPAAEEGEDFRLASQDDAVATPDINEGDLIFSENMKWMFDFDEAIAKGMGFKINLTPEQARDGFDRVFVLGLKLGVNKEKGKETLEELFSHHQSSRKGMAILQQGAPTNNTEDDESAYSWQHDPDDSFDIYFGDGDINSDPVDADRKTDGRWLAECLGIAPEALQSVENYYNTDIAEAGAMQKVLWPATMGHFMDSMMNPVFSDNTIEFTRWFFTNYVSGRGKLPAIRVGKQPYGILPATNYTNMQWFEQPTAPPIFYARALGTTGFSGYLSRLYRILMDIDKTWMSLTDKVSYVGKEGDPHQLLLDVIGLHPDSVEIYKRYANSFKQVHNIYSLIGFLHPGLFTFYPNSYYAAALLLAKYGYQVGSKNPEPDIFKKLFFENAWLLKGDVVDKVPSSETEVISEYTNDNKNYISWLIEAAEDSHDKLRLQDGFKDDRPPTALL